MRNLFISWPFEDGNRTNFLNIAVFVCENWEHRHCPEE
jgi:hypothetical protein